MLVLAWLSPFYVCHYLTHFHEFTLSSTDGIRNHDYSRDPYKSSGDRSKHPPPRKIDPDMGDGYPDKRGGREERQDVKAVW
jgi:hypothetical protein